MLRVLQSPLKEYVGLRKLNLVCKNSIHPAVARIIFLSPLHSNAFDTDAELTFSNFTYRVGRGEVESYFVFYCASRFRVKVHNEISSGVFNVISKREGQLERGSILNNSILCARDKRVSSNPTPYEKIPKSGARKLHFYIPGQGGRVGVKPKTRNRGNFSTDSPSPFFARPISLGGAD